MSRKKKEGRVKEHEHSPTEGLVCDKCGVISFQDLGCIFLVALCNKVF